MTDARNISNPARSCGTCLQAQTWAEFESDSAAQQAEPEPAPIPPSQITPQAWLIAQLEGVEWLTAFTLAQLEHHPLKKEA